MNAPTHIRFTADEAVAIDAYAAAHGLRKASAVRELLRLGLSAATAAASTLATSGSSVAADSAAFLRLEKRLEQQVEQQLAQLHSRHAAAIALLSRQLKRLAAQGR